MAAANRRAFPLSRELWALGHAVYHPGPFVLVFLVALAALGLAYQARPAYLIQAGSHTDLVFWSRVNGGEQDPASHATFRWTTADTVLKLPGVGVDRYRVRLDLSGARPPGCPPPDLLILSRGTEVAHLHPGAARGLYEVTLPAAATAALDGDLVLELKTLNPFSPPADSRQLGVVVFGVQVQPAGAGPVTPSLAVWLGLAASAVLLVLLLGLVGWGPRMQAGGGLVWVGSASGFLLVDRLWLTPLPGILLQVLALAGLALLLLGPLWRLLYRAGGIAWPEADQRGLLGLYGLAFVARLAGQLHPQTVVIDLIFHEHQLEKVLAGQFLFTIPSAEWGGHQTFYLPTAYVLMLPLQWLLGDKLLTIRLFSVALDTLSVFLVYYLARRACGDGRAGLLAAGLQVTFPLAVLPFSWGITANLYGQFAGLAVIAVLAGCYDRLTRPGPWLLLVAVLTGALLSHPGSVQLTGLLLAGVILVWGLLDFRFSIFDFRLETPGATPKSKIQNRKSKIRPWLALVVALVVATSIAWFGYYGHFAAFELHEYAALQQERAATAAQGGFSIRVGGEVADKSLGLTPRLVHDRGSWLVEGVKGFGAEAWAYFHTWPLLWAIAGLYAARRGAAPNPTRRRMLWLAGVWAAVVVLYAVVGLVANLYVRYALFALPLVALGGGLLLSALTRRGRWGAWLVAALLLAVTVQALAFWYMRITYANK